MKDLSLTSHCAPLSDTEKMAWLRLSRTENVGPVTFFNLVDFYGTASRAIEEIPEIVKRKKSKRKLKVPPVSQIEKEYNAVKKAGGEILAACESAYSLPLTSIDDAPPVITVFGRTDLMLSPCLAIVGARNASLNACKYTTKMARRLGEAGQIIVSGLARGIDTAAHTGALETGTIAVVAGGADIVYPKENQKLYDQIRETGLIIAENPLGMPPRNMDFPRRNRIVSGLSQGVVVVEAARKSGSLITARLAAEQGRDVFAMPGAPYDPRAAGPNSLIRDGAVMVRDADDIPESLGNYGMPELFSPPQTRFPKKAETAALPLQNGAPAPVKPDITEADDAADIVRKHLSFTPLGLDELARACQLTISTLQFVLMEMELAGQIERLPGNRVVLVKE